MLDLDVRAAICFEPGTGWKVDEVELDEPHDHEVLVRVLAAGLCHSDDHLQTGDFTYPLPQVGGHEACGIIERVGPGVQRVGVGDKVVVSYLPACGHCYWCSRGMQQICDNGADAADGFMLDGTARIFHGGRGIGAMMRVGSFANWMVVAEEQCIKVDDDAPPEQMCLLSCGVPTGFGAMVTTAEARPGDVCLTMGCGGIGMNSVQGAASVRARVNIAIDPSEFHRTMALERFGATHAFATIDEARDLIAHETNGQGVDAAVVAIGITRPEHISEALSTIRKRGICAVIGLGAIPDEPVPFTVNLFDFIVFAKQLRGVLFGWSSFNYDIPNLAKLYRAGRYNLDDLVTRTYGLDQVNQGYADMHAGKNIRGVLVLEH
jgi:S-(hydroxymethyl)glutathione dehydrogenase/alcohol dehydrogenase